MRKLRHWLTILNGLARRPLIRCAKIWVVNIGAFGVNRSIYYLPADTNYHRRNIFHIDERIEIFRAGEIGKMNDVVRYLRDLAAHFLSRSQVQLDTFTGVALKKASDRRVGLQSWFYPARTS